VKYIIPVVYPDTIHIGTKSREIKADRIVLKSFYYSEKNGKIGGLQKHRKYLLIIKLKKNPCTRRIDS
jgi:acyl-CoA thioester hydrolase